jgi:hypothetical protein
MPVPGNRLLKGERRLAVVPLISTQPRAAELRASRVAGASAGSARDALCRRVWAGVAAWPLGCPN